MQKTKRKATQLLWKLLLAVWMFVVMGTGVYAASGDRVQKDGVHAQLFTDKDSYRKDETVNASVSVENHTGRRIGLKIRMNDSEEIKIANGSQTYEVSLQDGETWNSSQETVSGGQVQTQEAEQKDKAQTIVWIIAGVLILIAIAAACIFGRMKKSSAAMMLCLAMATGMLVIGTKAAAADISGSMDLSCAVQADSTEVTISAVVDYIIYEEESTEEASDETVEATKSEQNTEESVETGAETASSESSKEVTRNTAKNTVQSTAASRSGEAEGTHDASENPDTRETPGTGESPDSGETSGTGETPDTGETPGTGETPDTGETPGTGENPGGGEVTEPEEPVTYGQTGYYVVWDDFIMSGPGGDARRAISSWDIVLPQSDPMRSSDGMIILDTGRYAKAQALRKFNEIEDEFVLEFSMEATAGMTEAILDLRKEDRTAVHFSINGDKLYLNSTELCPLPVDQLAMFKLHIYPAEGKFIISVDGTTIKENGMVKEFSFLNPVNGIDRFYIETGKEDCGQIVIGTLRAYTGFYVNEKFLDGTDGTVNDDWTVSGDVRTIYKQGTQGPDNYSVLLADGAGITRKIEGMQNGGWIEFQQLKEESSGTISMILADDQNNTFQIATIDGSFGFYRGETFVPLYNCADNLWYHIMLKQTDDGVRLYLNHKLKNKEQSITLPFEKFTRITFASQNGEVLLDDILVKDWNSLPEDYVPEPETVEKEEGAALVGLQSCNLWVEGEHFGYDWLTDWPERTPVLGYYDEILPEVADWELKFKVEHGIDFELFCWYRPMNGNDEPIKMARNARALHDGYMNAEYSDRMKFAITWESGSSVSGLDDFKENVIPYWIEQYFKDERYMIIDNKPFVGMYDINNLKKYFGGSIEGVKAAVDAIKEACVQAGFDGAYVVMCNSNADSAAEIARAGFDGQYAYSWGHTSYNASTQIKGMQAVQNALTAVQKADVGVIPVASQGWWSKAWAREDGKYCSPEDFQSVLQWMKEDFMPTLNQDSLGAEMVLLDNWNEYGEGHFIMPSQLAGFDYLDAVRGVFGDGDGIGGLHNAQIDVVPTQNQADRIQHMYVQDRHVVLVDKDADTGKTEPMEGYSWLFDTDNDAEGWTVDQNAGKWIKDLAECYVRGGQLYGKTLTEAQLQEAVSAGTYPSGATADPSLLSPDDLNLSAAEALTVKVRMRGVGGSKDIGKPALYFTTTEDAAFSGSKVITASYMEEDDGYAEVTFSTAANALWSGTIKQLRLDPIERDGEFFIDSIQVMKRKDAGEAEVYLDGSRIYTSSKVETEAENYLFPAKELDKLLSVYVSETLEKDSLQIYADGSDTFFAFPYSGEVKMLVNGTAAESIGAVLRNEKVYVPILDLFENMGSVTDASGTEHPAYTVEVIPGSGTAKTRIDIRKYVDNSVLKAYYFTTDDEGWTYGGANTTKIPAANGLGALEMAADGSDTRLWSPEKNQFNVSLKKADHIRMRIKTDEQVQNPAVRMLVYADGGAYKHSYNLELTQEQLLESGFYEVSVDLAEAKVDFFKTAVNVDRVCIYWYNDTVGGTQTFSMDSFEVLDLEADSGEEEPDPSVAIIEESPYTIRDWDFTESQGTWIGCKETTVEHDKNAEALKVTAKNGVMGVSASASENGLFVNPVNVSSAETTHILVRVQAEEELSSMDLTIQYAGTDEGVGESVSYTAVPYQTDVNGGLYALVDLCANEQWRTDRTIVNIEIYPAGSITQEDNGKTVRIDSVEILDKSWFIEFDSTYFTHSEDGWIEGGTTRISQKKESLVIDTPTDPADYRPRVWSMGTDASGNLQAPYNYTNTQATHVRVRLKAVIPETLPDTMTEEEKTQLAQTVSEELKMNLQLADGTGAGSLVLPYSVDTEDFVTVTFDIRSMIPDGKTLGRIGLEVFNGGNEILCKAGVTVLIDSVQFLRKAASDEEAQALKVLIIGNSITQHAPNKKLGWVGDWGMAATCQEKDYVHLLTNQIHGRNEKVEVKAINVSEYEKYFYDWSLIGDPKDKYANWNADIIIAAFGANVKNGVNENDPDYENPYVFNVEKYKKIIDKFNPDGDAKVIAAATILTKADIVEIIHRSAQRYGYTYVDMTEWTTDEYRAYAYEQTFKDLYLEAYPGEEVPEEGIKSILSHPGDLGMEKIAQELWEVLDASGWIPQVQTPVGSYRVEYYYDGMQDVFATVTGTAEENTMIPYAEKAQGGYVLERTEPENFVVHASSENVFRVYYKTQGYEIAEGGSFYFTDNVQSWTYAGEGTVFGYDGNGAIKVSSATGNPVIKSPGTALSLDGITHIRLRMKTDANLQPNMYFACYVTHTSPTSGNTWSETRDGNIAYETGEDGQVVLLIDVSSLTDRTSGGCSANEPLNAVRICPFGSSANEEYANVQLWLDSVEFLRKADME